MQLHNCPKSVYSYCVIEILVASLYSCIILSDWYRGFSYALVRSLPFPLPMNALLTLKNIFYEKNLNYCLYIFDNSRAIVF